MFFWGTLALEDAGFCQQGKITFSALVDGRWQLVEVRIGNPEWRLVADHLMDLHCPASSPKGDRLAYATGDGRIMIATRGEQAVAADSLPHNCSHPAWSPDGDKLACTCYGFSGGMEDSDLWLLDLKSNRAHCLMEQPGMQKHPAWSPDGETLAYTQGYRRGHRIIEEIWVVDAKGKKPRALLADASINIRPAWSPDGLTLAFVSDRNGNVDIWTADKNGRNLKVLTHHEAMDTDPAWSPDGASISFVSTRSGELHPWIVTVRDQRVFQLPTVSNAALRFKEPFWSW